MVSSFLRDLDTTWNPSHGLKIWKAGHLKPILPAEVEKTGKLLLIVHGTFSNADAILTPLKDGGFLKRAVNHYQQILAFDHPSVSVSPVLNAIDLARQLEGTAAEIHVIAHSRGGLVSRWWLEALDRGKGARKAVLVGSPLNGTSLATPRSIRSLMSWMSNLSRVIGEVSGAGGSMIPFLTVIAGLARIAATVTNLASKVPAVDAAIAMVPGLAAMSRENFELARLNVQMKALPAYFAVTSDFQPPAVGWEFWKAFQGASIRAVNALVDPLFDQANDLVVDTGSMDHLWTGGLIKDKFDFGGTNSLVYHTNYFEQQPMLDWMATKLGIP
jgi:pimeloyl-ACP methyl ester carboxylesterase